MTTTYKKLDYLPDLPLTSLSLATPLTFKPYSTNSTSRWDNNASYFSMNGYDAWIFSFQGIENATYEFGAMSYYIPDLITVADNLGNVLDIVTENTTIMKYSDANSSLLMLSDFVAPYTGTYYVGVTFDKSVTNIDKSTMLSIYEDVDTIPKKPLNSPSYTINHSPTGTLNILGSAKQDEVLTISSSLSDEDELGDFEYQWLRNGVEILNASNDTYQLTSNDVGKKISLKISYIDGGGTLETVTSYSTGIVTKGKDLLIGTNGNDKLIGTEGNDTFTGGLGVDKLTGLQGSDVFKFNKIKETGIKATTRDTITDFTPSEGDKIDLSEIDSYVEKAGDQPFYQLLMGEKFSGKFAKTSQLFFETKTGILWGNVDTKSGADFSIKLNGVTSLTLDDFIL